MTFWSFISELGVHSSYDDKLVRRIRLTNQFTFVTFFLLSAINYYVVGDLVSSLIIGTFALPCILV